MVVTQRGVALPLEFGGLLEEADVHGVQAHHPSQNGVHGQAVGPGHHLAQRPDAPVRGPIALHDVESVPDVQVGNADAVDVQEGVSEVAAREGHQVKLGLVGPGHVAEAVLHRPVRVVSMWVFITGTLMT